LQELKSSGKIVQGMTRDGVVEVNKATGGAANISVREPGAASVADNVQNPGGVDVSNIGGVVDRVHTERRAMKKRAVNRENAKIFKRSQHRPETSRLQFTDAERADPGMSKVIRKSDKSANHYEKAQGKISKARTPTSQTLSSRTPTTQRVSDKPGGHGAAANPRTRLVFREGDKPPNGKLQHFLDKPGSVGSGAALISGSINGLSKTTGQLAQRAANRTGREAGLAVHGQVRAAEGDNTGIQAAHFSEQAAEGAARKIGNGYKRLKFQPQRAALRAEEKTIKANANALYERSLRMDPELASVNPLKKAMQKNKIKRDYAKAFREGNIGGVEAVKNTAATAKNVTQKASDTVKNVVKFTARHWKGLALFGGAFFIIILLIAGLGSCAAMFSGGFNGVVGTSYTAEDSDIIIGDADYTALETQLGARIDNIASEYPGYDEYRVSADEIGHDPYELASYLTAKYNSYTRAQIQAELRNLFNQQYTLTITPVTEVRYRTETRTDTETYTDSETGESYTESYTYEVQIPYDYHILYVSLTNRSLGSVALSNLTPEQAQMYAVYMETKGNKPELFAGNVYVNNGAGTGPGSPGLTYTIPPDALTDTQFAAMIQEAEKYLGYPYVWGGSTPATSFDCSGFVCWVINHSGAGNVGRTTANGLLNDCTVVSPADAKPGDLVFFQGTYNVRGASHVGIYVGNGMMIAAGNPIQYTNITTSYWTSHFLAFGRLP